MSRIRAIEQHYTKNWGSDCEECPFTKGPIHELPVGFKVLAFPPHAERPMWSYATCGMSSVEDLNKMELHLFSPKKSDTLVELLYAIAHFHHTGSPCRVGDTVNFGRPWLESSLCSHGLISLPYLDGPNLENFLDETGTIKFYWLIPIPTAELELKKSTGINALESKFDSSNFDYCNPSRPSVT